MHFRSLKKTASDVSLSETLDMYGEGEGLYLIDVVSQEDDLAERIGSKELCHKLRGLLYKTLDKEVKNEKGYIYMYQSGLTRVDWGNDPDAISFLE